MSVTDIIVEFFRVWIIIFTTIWEKMPNDSRTEIVLVIGMMIFGPILIRHTLKAIGFLLRSILEEVRYHLR